MIRKYCLSKKGCSESFPFNESTLVFKVGSKMFALCDLGKTPAKLNLKCQPDWAEQLKENHEEIACAFHMNKKHWISVEVSINIDKDFIFSLIDNSYGLVFDKLTKKEQNLIAK